MNTYRPHHVDVQLNYMKSKKKLLAPLILHFMFRILSTNLSSIWIFAVDLLSFNLCCSRVLCLWRAQWTNIQYRLGVRERALSLITRSYNVPYTGTGLVIFIYTVFHFTNTFEFSNGYISIHTISFLCRHI